MKPKQEQTPIKILLTDDDEDDRYFFKEALKEVPAITELKTIVDGAKLMDYLLNNSNALPDVLFLDLNMPRKNGAECLTEIKQHEKLKSLPVVIYSTALVEEEANKLYKVGANYYLHKCDFNNLKQRIEQVLALLAENLEQPARDKFILGNQEAL